MSFRHALIRLGRPEARRAFGRTWLWLCLAGAALTLAADAGRHFFLVLVVWLVCVFAPVRIAVEALHSTAPRLRAALQRELRGRPDRYASRDGMVLMAEWFAGRDVQAPRLAPPDLAPKIIEAASRLCDRALRAGGPTGVHRVLIRCVVLLDRWVAAIADANGGVPPGLWDPASSIQEQWTTLRAVAALAALTKILAAVYEDSAGAALEDGAAIRGQADAAMDYVDQVGLRLPGPEWTAMPGIPRAALPADDIGRLTDTWLAFCSGPLPAPRRLSAFLDAAAA